MCGIAGVVDLAGRPVAPAVLSRMCDAIAHRGPDDAGQHVDGAVGLGNRRLAIIDLSPAGHQPMSNPDGSLWLAYNGEVYNFPELRRELEALGHTFRSRTDTEVVLRAYEAWGPGCLDRFNGMFAFALWDVRRRKLLLARDRYGIKPLYYLHQGDRLVFASEVKAVLQEGSARRDVDLLALREFFTFENILSDRTLFQGIRLLPPGHYLEADLATREVRVHSYWDFDFSQPYAPAQLPWEECATHLRELFQQAVERQLISDVPVGSYLSGGMDTGSIVAVASRQVPRLMTFTGGFDVSQVNTVEAEFDERAAAESMATLFDTQHYEVVLHPGDMRWVLPDVVRHLEEPRASIVWQTYCVAKLASRFVKVSLSGAAGDELFAGYPWRYRSAVGARSFQEFVPLYLGYWQRRLFKEEEVGSRFFDGGVLEATSGFSPADVFVAVFGREQPARLWGQNPAPDAALLSALYFEAKTFLHGLLVVEDKLSMAHSLETRLPFLDNDLVDFAQRVPPSYKFDPAPPADSYADTSGKLVLREAMKPLVPAQVLKRKKQGFIPPEEAWYRGPMMGWIQDTLLSPGARSRGYFRPEAVRQVLEGHQKGAPNHHLIFALLCFEWWCRHFLDGQG